MLLLYCLCLLHTVRLCHRQSVSVSINLSVFLADMILLLRVISVQICPGYLRWSITAVPTIPTLWSPRVRGEVSEISGFNLCGGRLKALQHLFFKTTLLCISLFCPYIPSFFLSLATSLLALARDPIYVTVTAIEREGLQIEPSIHVKRIFVHPNDYNKHKKNCSGKRFSLCAVYLHQLK